MDEYSVVVVDSFEDMDSSVIVSLDSTSSNKLSYSDNVMLTKGDKCRDDKVIERDSVNQSISKEVCTDGS